MEVVPIVKQEIIPHPGTDDDFLTCIPCDDEGVNTTADVIVVTTYEDNSKLTRGMCTYHADLVEC